MVAVTKIKVNRGGGSSSSDNPEDRISSVVKELKNLTNLFSKNFKLGQSGLGGNSGGLLSRLGAGAITAGGAAFGALAGHSAFGGVRTMEAGQVDPNNSVEKALIDGKESYLEINNKTGEIIRILDRQQAEDLEILDEKGNLKNAYTMHKSRFDEITEQLPRWKDAVILNADTLELIDAESRKELELQKGINEAMRKKLSRLGGNVSLQEAAADPLATLKSAGTISPVNINDFFNNNKAPTIQNANAMDGNKLTTTIIR